MSSYQTMLLNIEIGNQAPICPWSSILISHLSDEQKESIPITSVSAAGMREDELSVQNGLLSHKCSLGENEDK